VINNRQVEEIFTRFQVALPEPLIELDYTSPYTLLVAVILSAQATDKSVNKVTKDLFSVADTPQKMVQLGEENLKKYIRSIGLFNSKASNIIAMSKMLLRDFNATVPSTLKELESLPGVGRKSANVILNSVFREGTIAVDTHVFRVANRIGFCNTKNVLATELALEKLVPLQFKLYAHHWMVLHGRYICKARSPACMKCLINDLCKYDKKT
jgi:endonuclease III